MGKANSKLSPEAVAELQKRTHFDKKEIHAWHRMFLRECPGGTLGREQLLAIYEQFFPFGDSAAFVGHLFRLYDVDESGAIDFEEYLSAVSITTRGKLDEKLQWAFRFYDQDGDGRVSASDMTATVDAIYRMMGGTISLADDEDTPAKRVEKVFKLMGKTDAAAQPLTYDEFQRGARVDPLVVQALLICDRTA